MNNKIALITGGSRGLGRDMALSFAKKGVDVVFTYHSNKQQAEGSRRKSTRSGKKHTSFSLMPEIGPDRRYVPARQPVWPWFPAWTKDRSA